MTAHRRRLVVLGLFLAFVVIRSSSELRAAADTLPSRLTDQEFWSLSEKLSESDGYFRSDNLLSNEIYYPEVMAQLLAQAKSGGVYLGVGPEQNFNYIVALKPKMVFITDVRRGNLHTQLMYKALFEMSANRVDFYGRLFSKKRPEALADTATATEIVAKYAEVQTGDEETFKQNMKAIAEHLTKAPHQLPLNDKDIEGIEYVYRNFYWFGPSITYNSSTGNGGGRGNMTNYASLMVAADGGGAIKSYLASEQSFKVMKDLEERNLLVPVVGNFGGPKALRAVGQYVRDHGATVSAFYLSNVEQYLYQDGIWRNFCANVAAMPLDETSTFIRSSQGGGGFGGGGLMNSLGLMQQETRACAGGA